MYGNSFAWNGDSGSDLNGNSCYAPGDGNSPDRPVSIYTWIFAVRDVRGLR